MHIAARAAIAAVPLVIGGVAISRSIASTREEHAEIKDQIAADTAEARADWTSWKRQLDSEFPGLELESSADHRRLDAFLKSNPAPEWVSVTHEGFTKARLEAHTPVSGKAFDADELTVIAGLAGGALTLGAGALAGLSVLNGSAVGAGLGAIGAVAGAWMFSEAAMLAVEPDNDAAVELASEVDAVSPLRA